MTMQIVPVDAGGIDNIASGLTGFSDAAEDQLQQSMMTSLFIAGASQATKGRAAYLLLDDGSRMWVPNTLRCWLVDLKIVTQTYESYDPTDKLLIRVTASDGMSYIYRCGLNSWTATSFLTNFKYLTREQLADQVSITLVPKGRATFIQVEYCSQGAFYRVQIPESEFTGEKLSYDTCLDVISYVNGTSHNNEDSPVVEAQVTPEEEPFEVPAEELDKLLEEIKQPRRARRKSSAQQPQEALLAD